MTAPSDPAPSPTGGHAAHPSGAPAPGRTTTPTVNQTDTPAPGPTGAAGPGGVIEDRPISRRAWGIALIVAFGAFMSQLDTSVVSVGLETIAGDLRADLADAQWVANGYLLALAVSLPACGWLGRRVGVTRLWLGALAAFTISSALCALAGNLGWLIALRAVQGLAAGLLIPAGQTVIGQAVGPGRLGKVMGTVGVPLTLAPALGPSAGGLLLHVASWPWLFWVNVPLGLVGLALGARYLPRTAGAAVGRLDWVGLLLVSTGVPLVVYGCTAWGQRGAGEGAVSVGGAVSPAGPGLGVVLPLALGAMGLLGFVVWSWRRPHPVLDPRLLRVPRFAAGGLAVAFGGVAMFGAGLLFPLYYQLGRGQSPLATGLLLISMSVGTSVALPVAGRLVDRFGGGPVAVVGGLVTALTTISFALAPLALSEVAAQSLLLVRGVAIAASVMPATTAAYRAVTAERLPDATTQVNILLRVGGALGGVIVTVVLTNALPAGVASAFQASFAWLAAASVLGVAAAAWLTVAECRARAAFDQGGFKEAAGLGCHSAARPTGLRWKRFSRRVGPA
jgi:EmrB/QacA subfamily drug resistance transporter